MSDLEDYLRSFGKQKEVKDSDIVIAENPKLRLIFQKYEEWMKKDMLLYEHCTELLEGIKCSAEDVRDVVVALKKYEPYKMFEFCGVFLSALVNMSDEDNFSILTTHFEKGVNFLGLNNLKNLTILGNTNNFTGAYMKKGVITVKGNVNNNAGEGLKDGRINIFGDVLGGLLGGIADGGEIHVEGDLGQSLSFISFTHNCSARIYHRGVQVWPKEKY